VPAEQMREGIAYGNFQRRYSASAILWWTDDASYRPGARSGTTSLCESYCIPDIEVAICSSPDSGIPITAAGKL